MPKFLTKDRILLVLLLIGMIPSTNFWWWAKPTIAVWLTLLLLHRFQNRPFLTKLYSILVFLACAATLWGVAYRFAPSAPPSVLLVAWSAMLAYVIKLLLSKNAVFSLSPSHWPAKPLACAVMVLVIGTGLLAHHGLNAFIGLPFTWAWWTSATWMLAALLIFYPRDIETPFAYLNGKQQFLLAMHIAIILHGQHGRYVELENQLYLNPAAVTQEAFRRGYDGLGVQSVLLEANARYHEDWAKGIEYLRANMKHGFIPRFAHALKNHPLSRDNLFYFTCAFGLKLQLKPGEQALDLLARPAWRELFVLTDQGRLLRLGEKGLTTLWNLENPPVAMAAAKNNAFLAILAKPNQVIVWHPDEITPILYLSHEGVWKDIKLSADGRTVYALSGDGTIELHRFYPEHQIWQYERSISVPLWQDADTGRKILVAPDGSGVFLLDAHGGLRWCGDSPAYGGFDRDARGLYYNPQAPKMLDIAFWADASQILLCNENGRVHMIDPQAKDLLPPVKADLFFNYNQSRWTYPNQTAAVAALPPIDMILQLDRNGAIHPIYMPQRYRMHPKQAVATAG